MEVECIDGDTEGESIFMAVWGVSGLTALIDPEVIDEECVNKHPKTKPPMKLNTLLWLPRLAGFSSGMS